MTRTIRVLAAAILLAGCSSAAPAPTAPASAAPHWERIVPGGDCQCAGGTEYSFYARAADPAKVVLYLDGGGACWSAGTCAPDSGNRYQTTVEEPNGEGLLDFADPRNPVAGYSAVYVPYCTADVHLGNAVTTYAAGLTIAHKGYVNGTAALDHLAATFSGATEVVVIGASAGSVSAPRYAALVADRLPGARVTAIADSSGSYPDAPQLNGILTGKAWGAGDALGGARSLPGLFARPGIAYARLDHAYDEDQRFHLDLAGVEGDVLGLLDANAARIEKAGIPLHTWVAPGDEHVVADSDDFYTETVGGVALADWVTSVLAGRPVDDVRCTDCR